MWSSKINIQKHKKKNSIRLITLIEIFDYVEKNHATNLKKIPGKFFYFCDKYESCIYNISYVYTMRELKKNVSKYMFAALAFASGLNQHVH